LNPLPWTPWEVIQTQALTECRPLDFLGWNRRWLLYS